MKRLAYWLGAVLWLGACAHTQAGLTTVPTVSDEQLARVPPERMEPVNQARTEQAEAKDEVARRELSVKQARNELDLANRELKVAQAEIQRVQQAKENTGFNRDAEGQKRAASQLIGAQAQEAAARSRIDLARAELKLAESSQKRSAQQKTLADAKLEEAKAQVLKESGDPAFTTVNTAAIEQRKQAAQAALAPIDAQIQLDESEVAAARTKYASDRERAKRTSGVGGSGENVLPPPNSTVHPDSDVRSDPDVRSQEAPQESEPRTKSPEETLAP